MNLKRFLRLVLIVLSASTAAMALDVVIDPYGDIDYDQINVYDLRGPRTACWCD